MYVTVRFDLEKGKMFVEADCAELFLDLCIFHLKEILKVTYPYLPLFRGTPQQFSMAPFLSVYSPAIKKLIFG
jgi:hypothetical protein